MSSHAPPLLIGNTIVAGYQSIAPGHNDDGDGYVLITYYNGNTQRISVLDSPYQVIREAYERLENSGFNQEDLKSDNDEYDGENDNFRAVDARRYPN